jgi:hypothetical protein
MKLIFFLIAFCLVSIRIYFSWSGMDRAKRGVSVSNMVIKSDNFYEEINYSGKFQLSDDETSFKSISPGGYFKFRQNDIKIKAESNLRGEIDYTIYDGKNDLPLNTEGKILLTMAIREMIARGYDAEERMERIYRKGGAEALLKEVDSIKMDQIRVMYLSRLFSIDSLSPNYLPIVISKIGSIGSDQDKVRFLTKITIEQLKTAQIDSAYFEIIKGVGSDMDKVNALQHIMNLDSIAETNTDKILHLIGGLGSDMDKANLFKKMIDKGFITGPCYDSLLDLISNMGSDMDKATLYKKLVDEKSLSESQWINLEDKISLLGSDMDKTNLLVEAAPKMPKSEAVRANYRKTAKSIGNDNDYGRAMRAIE